MKERGSKEKVIQAINNYMETILDDFFSEVQALIEESRPLLERLNENRIIQTPETSVLQRFEKLLYSIESNNLEEGLEAFSEFIRTEDGYDEYWELYDSYFERFEKISSFSIEYKFMQSALGFTKL